MPAARGGRGRDGMGAAQARPEPARTSPAPVRSSRDGLLLRPWFRRPLLVPWTAVKGVRIKPADRWSGRNAVVGSHSRYMIQVKLAGEWRRVGRILEVRYPLVPQAILESLFGAEAVEPTGEAALFSAHELIRSLWEDAGGEAGDEDDNWPRPTRADP